MLQIRTVLCPLGFDELDPAEIALAAEVCRSFGARLILHHNLTTAPLGPAMSWMWHQEHPNGGDTEKRATERLRQLLDEVPEGVPAEARLSAGTTGPAILEVEDQVGADLVVMTTRGAGTEDHASVAEQVVERSLCPVLVVRQDAAGADLHFEPWAGEAFRTALVATDFSPSSERALAYAFDLARSLPLHLHLLHVVTTGRSLLVEGGVPEPLPEGRVALPVEQARLKLEALVPEDLQHQVSLHVEVGDPAEKIAEAAERLGASYILMGAHARGLLRRLFTRDTTRALLHRAPCPVWFVPDSRAA